MRIKFVCGFLLSVGLIVLNCGLGKKGIKAYPGHDLAKDKLAFLDLRSPVSNFKGKFPPGSFTIYIGKKSFEIGERQILNIKSGKLSVEIEGDVLEEIQLNTWVGQSDKMRPHKKYGVTYTGKRVFYPDQRARLNFMADSGKKYRCKFQLKPIGEKNLGFIIDCCIIEKRTGKVVSNQGIIKYN
jgi:hypothetical protein